MAFSDLDEELENLRGGQNDSHHYEYDDDGEVSSESATLDWDYVHPNAIAGASINNSSEDLTEALRWVLQDKKRQDTAHYWKAADKLGIDLHALGVQSGSTLLKEPNSKKMGKLWNTLGFHHVTQAKDETVEAFQDRMNDPANWDAMKADSISAKPGFENEFSFPDLSGKGRTGVMQAMRSVAKGYVDAGSFGLGEGGAKKYELALDNMTNKVAKHLPVALQGQAAYFASKLGSGEHLDYGDSYAKVLEGLPVGSSFNRTNYGDTTDLSHNLKGIGEVFGAIRTGGVDRQDLAGVTGWKDPISSYSAGHLRDVLALTDDEGNYAQVAENLGVSATMALNPLYGLEEPSPLGIDITPEMVDHVSAGRPSEDYAKPKQRKDRKAAAMAAAVEAERMRSSQPISSGSSGPVESIPVAPVQEALFGMPKSIPEIHRRDGDEDLIISNHEQGSEGWHNARNKLLTAADAGLVNGGKYSEEGLRRKMAAASGTEAMSENLYNSNFVRGHAIEPKTREWYSKQFNEQVTEMGLIENPKLPGLGVSVDGLVGKEGLFEAKAPAFKFSNVTEGHAYYDQVQMQMAVTGRNWADIVQAKQKQGYVPRGEDPLEYDVTRHKKNEAYIEKQLPKWNKLARDVRIASKTASDGDLAADAFEYRPKQQESDFESRLDALNESKLSDRADDFEERLQARLSERGLVNKVNKDGSETLSMKDSVKEGMLEAKEELDRRESGGAGGGGGGGSLFGGIGKGLDALGHAAGAAGRGDLLGAAKSAIRGIPIVGGALAGGLEAMQGFIDRATDEAAIIGDAKTMGVDYNNLNNTQRQGLVYGINQQQASNLMSTTSSASQGMATGDPSGASKMVVGSRGFLSFADIQQYGEEPLELGRIAIARMKAANLSKGQISSLLRNAGLGDALKLVDSSDVQDQSARNLAMNISKETQQDLAATSGITNAVISKSRSDIILEETEKGNLPEILNTATTAMQMVEAGTKASMELFGASTRTIEEALGGKVSDVVGESVKSLVKGSSSEKLPTVVNEGSKTSVEDFYKSKDSTSIAKGFDETSEAIKAGLTKVGAWARGKTETPKDVQSGAKQGDPLGWELDPRNQKRLPKGSLGNPAWEKGLSDLQSLPRPTDKDSQRQYDAAMATLRSKLGKGRDAQSSQVPQRAQANTAKDINVTVSVDKFNVAATARSEGKVLSKASRAGQPAPNTI